MSVYEKELLAIMMAVKQWHYYLITNPFIIRTDQRSLKHLLMQKVTTPLQHKWLAKLMGYNYVIEYKKGRENVAADALSRVQGTTLFTIAISYIEPLVLDRIMESQNKDVEVQHVIQKLKNEEILPRFKWNGKWLIKENRMVVGGSAELRDEIVKLCHESPMGGHSGDVDELMRDREAAIKVLRQSLLKAQNRMKQQADKHRTERVFEPGSWVYSKLQPYMQNSLRVHKHSKLTPKYFGPFLIVEKVGAVAYTLDLPSDALIHP
nr:retrotransposon-related protein [Tanacetum cinerariifolium]